MGETKKSCASLSTVHHKNHVITKFALIRAYNLILLHKYDDSVTFTVQYHVIRISHMEKGTLGSSSSFKPINKGRSVALCLANIHPD